MVSKKKKKKRSSPTLRLIFRPKSEIQRFFPPKIRWSPEIKKKGLRQNWDWFFDRNPKFKGFFRPKSGDLQKSKKKVFAKIETDFSTEIQRFFPPKIRWSPKKKGLRQNWDWFFGQIRKFKRLRGGCFPMGGAIFNFSQKIGLKTTKNVRFCILHEPMGPPPPPPPWLRYCSYLIIRLSILE